MSGWTPVPKVTAAALGGAVASLAVWGLDSAGVEAPPAIAAALASLLAFAAGYLRQPASSAGWDGYANIDNDAGEVELLYIVLIVTVVFLLLLLLGVI